MESVWLGDKALKKTPGMFGTPPRADLKLNIQPPR